MSFITIEYNESAEDKNCWQIILIEEIRVGSINQNDTDSKRVAKIKNVKKTSNQIMEVKIIRRGWIL